jgi:hypothetical protein
MVAELIAIALIQLTGPGSQVIHVNPDQIVTTRVVRPTQKDQFGPGVQCLVHTADGKYISVLETCDEVRLRMERMR